MVTLNVPMNVRTMDYESGFSPLPTPQNLHFSVPPSIGTFRTGIVTTGLPSVPTPERSFYLAFHPTDQLRRRTW